MLSFVIGLINCTDNSFLFENTFSGPKTLDNLIVKNAWNHIILESFYDPLEPVDKTQMFFEN